MTHLSLASGIVAAVLTSALAREAVDAFYVAAMVTPIVWNLAHIYRTRFASPRAPSHLEAHILAALAITAGISLAVLSRLTESPLDSLAGWVLTVVAVLLYDYVAGDAPSTKESSL